MGYGSTCGPESRVGVAQKILTVENLTKVTPRISPGWGSNQVLSHWSQNDIFALCEVAENSGNHEEDPFPTPRSCGNIAMLRQFHTS